MYTYAGVNALRKNARLKVPKTADHIETIELGFWKSPHRIRSFGRTSSWPSAISGS